MKRFDLDNDFSADCILADTARAGQIFHIRRYPSGKGMTLTGIARYFVWQPSFAEGYHRYWRVDCFVKVHPLAPEPMALGEALVAALVRENLCAEPIWLSTHVSDCETGRAFGKVFEED